MVACADDAVAKQLQQACHTPYFRPYTNPDVIGCELGGAVKNVIALAVGIAVGMGLGRQHQGHADHPRPGRDLPARRGARRRPAHLRRAWPGMGDLVATCSSPLSRNRTFGENLGRGMALADAAASTSQVTEGVKSAEPVLELARAHGVEMPITEVVAGVTQGRIGIGGGRRAARVAVGQAGALRRLTRAGRSTPPRGERHTERRERKIRVAVVFGGRSPEHAISCLGAGNVLAALDRDRYEVVPVGIARDGRWVLAPDDPGSWPSRAASCPPWTPCRPGAEIAARLDPVTRGLVVTAPGDPPRSSARSTWCCRCCTARTARTARSRACWRWRGASYVGGRGVRQRGQHGQGVHEADLRRARPADRPVTWSSATATGGRRSRTARRRPRP